MTDLVPGLENLDLFKIFGISSVGIIESSLKFPDIGLVLLLDPGNLGLVAGLNLNKGPLEFFNGALAALPAIRMFVLNDNSYEKIT